MSNSGKVKCTCGWSWNKSDSSKKDMYVCHECGRDNSNNMKNGGWLDNYGDEENANNPSVSLPEGFIGEGTFNGPKFDNPAWGGQFQMGGSLPGAVGHMYARYEGGGEIDYPRTKNIPSEGKYAKKTLPSAQNGQEMQYYREGLDWQPKTISKNGGWLDDYDVAQDGKKVKLKDERLQAIRSSESTNVKKKNFDLEQSRETKTFLNQLAAQQKEEKRRKALTQDQREREDYNARNEERGSIQATVPESKWERTKAIVSNPMTAIGYAARNESLPARFQLGPRNEYDYAVDWINPLQGVAALSEIPGELGRGEYLNAGLSALDAIDLGVYAKGAMKASKPLLNKAGKALGTESGLLSNAYKLNPWAFKANPEMGYRMLGREGFQDAVETGVLRAKPIPNQAPSGGISLTRNTNRNPNTGKMQGALDRPYFADGVIDERYAADYMAAVNKAENNLVRIATHRGIAPSQAGSIPLENATLYKKNWLQGYKQIPKQEDGGIIKDDRGQWANNKKNSLSLQSNWLSKFE